MNRTPLLVIGGSVVFAAAFIAVVGRATPEQRQQSVDRYKVTNCEASYNRIKDERRVEPSTLRVAWEACQMLRRDYRQKWGFDP